MRSIHLVVLTLVACVTPKPPPRGAKEMVVIPAPPVGVDPPVVTVPPTPKPATIVKATKTRTIEGITEYRLPNGLQILLFPDATQSNVTVNITYLVGSRHEGYGETGMAHLLEHMMFKGTKRYRDLSKLLDAKGAQNNASTDYDRTNYYETFPATQETVDWVLDLEADRMVNSTFLEADLASEFSVVRNEFEAGENDPTAILWERILSSAYLWHNYGKSVIGSRADIEKVPASALREFYKTYYQPDTAVLVVAGKFDEARTLATIETTFGAIPKATRTLPPTYTVEPVQDGEREVILRRAGDVHVVGMAWHAVAGTSPDYPAVEAAIDILTRQPSGRLYKKLVEAKLASSVSGAASANHDPQVAMVFAEIRDAKQLARVEQTIVAEVEALGRTPIASADLERWRASTIKEIELTMADSRRLAADLTEFIALGDWRTLFAYRDRVEKVTVADVARVATQYLVSTNRTTGRFFPTGDKASPRAPLTETPDVQAIVKAIEGGAQKEQGEAFVATPDTIEARTTRKELKNGIKAAFLPKKTRGGKVILDLRFHFGDERSLQGKAVIADLTGSMLGRGTTKKTFQELEDLEDQLKARISLSSSASLLVLRIETLRDKLPAALDLAAEMIISPSFSAKELEIARQENLAALEAALHDPSTIASIVLAQTTSPWPRTDPRYTMSTTEEIAAVKRVRLDDIKAFYKDFIGGGHGELAVIGDFDPAVIATQVDRLFGAWTSKRPYARLVDQPFDVPATSRSIDVRDKENAQLVVSHHIAMRDTDPDYPAWLIVGQILGGDNGSRLWQRMREKEGLTYGVYASTYADAFDASGGIDVEAIVAPQNLAKAKASLLDELARLASGPFTAEEVEYAKTTWLKAQENGWSSDQLVVGALATGLYRNRTFEFTKQLRAKLQAVTAADVTRVAKQYVRPDRLVIVDAGDQSKAAAKTPTPTERN